MPQCQPTLKQQDLENVKSKHCLCNDSFLKNIQQAFKWYAAW